MATKEITITEALADIRTLKARITKQYEFVMQYIAWPSNMLDPLSHSGGAVKAVASARQSIHDMQERIIYLRVAISLANAQEMLEIDGETRSINGWLAWKRETAPDLRRYLALMRSTLDKRRNDVGNEVHRINQQRGAVAGSEAALSIGITSAVDEVALAEEVEHFERVWGDLDGQLSLRNSTIRILVPV